MKKYMKKDIHLKPEDFLKGFLSSGKDLGELTIACGQKHRVDICLKYLDNVEKAFTFMDYNFYTGYLNKTKVSVGNSGMFAPDTAIVVDLLIRAGAKKLVRVGSCGSMSQKVKVGNVVAAETAIRGEGVTQYYVDQDHIPSSDAKLTENILSQINDIDVFNGKIWTMDAIFREIPSIINPIIDKGAIAVDMVSSVIMTLANINKIPVASILAVSDNIINGDHGFRSKEFKKAEKSIIDAVFNYVRIMS